MAGNIPRFVGRMVQRAQIQPSSLPLSKCPQNQQSFSIKMQTNPAQQQPAPVKKTNVDKSSRIKDKRPKFGETPLLKPLPIERQKDALYPDPNPRVGEFYITRPKKSP